MGPGGHCHKQQVKEGLGRKRNATEGISNINIYIKQRGSVGCSPEVKPGDASQHPELEGPEK